MKPPKKCENFIKIAQEIRPCRVFMFRNWVKFGVKFGVKQVDSATPNLTTSVQSVAPVGEKFQNRNPE